MLVSLVLALLLLSAYMHVSSSPMVGSKRPSESDIDYDSVRHNINFVNSGRNDTRKIVALGDLKGDLNIFHHILKSNGVVDLHNNWNARDVIVIQLVNVRSSFSYLLIIRHVG